MDAKQTINGRRALDARGAWLRIAMRGLRGLSGTGLGGLLSAIALATLLTVGVSHSVSAEPSFRLGANATLAEIKACATQALPESAGRIGFRVEAVDRTGQMTASRAEIRWQDDDAGHARIVLRVSEPAKTAGTALLIIDRDQDQPEFFLRLPELTKAKRIRSRRLRGPVLGTDFSFEDLQRLREPLDKTELELVGESPVAGRPAWLLEALPGGGKGDSEYSRVLTYVDQASCLPIQIDLFEGEDRLRKRLRAPIEEIKQVRFGRSDGADAGREMPHVFVMEDLRRGTQTVVRIEAFEAAPDWPAEQFTKAGLEAPASPDPK
ncbi:MAG: outer membrane lipoprotein-sorting protein [Myxococcota bacterium]